MIKPIPFFSNRLVACLIFLVVFATGCGGGGSSASPSSPSVPDGSGQGITPGATSASVLLQFEVSAPVTVLPRIAEQAVAFRVTAFQANGKVAKVANSTRVSQLQIDGLPIGPILLRTEFLDAGGQVIGYLDRFTSLVAGQTTVLGLSGFVAGTPSPGAPFFPSIGGVPTHLVFEEFPSTLTVGKPFDVKVVVLDAMGTPLPGSVGSVTLSAENGHLAGRTSHSLTEGKAAFSGLTLSSQNGSVVLKASAIIGGHELEATSLPIAWQEDGQPPNQGVPATLRFLDTPQTGIAGQPLTSVRVEVLDVYGQRVSTSGQVITLSLSQNPVPPDGAVLSGTLTLATSQGVAAFPQVALDRAGQYRFLASAPDVVGASSTIVNVAPAPVPPLSLGTGYFDGLLISTRVGAGYYDELLYPRELLSADFNGDGIDDLVAINPHSSKYEIIFSVGRGDGTFLTPVALPTTLKMSTAAFGDLDSDGDLDLVVTSLESGGVARVYLNDGTGNFSEQTPLLNSQPGCFEIVVADFNGDSREDIATANRDSGSVTVFLNQGNAIFTAGVHVPVAGAPVGIAAADLDGDGDIDLVTANELGSNVTILENTGGSFSIQSSHLMGSGTFGLFLADMNGDNRPDIVTANRDANSVSIRLNNGDFNFSAPEHLAAGRLPQDIVAGDIDGDGKLDLVTVNLGDSTSTVLLRRETGWETLIIPVGSSPIALRLRDFNRDGYLDLATANLGEASMIVRLNDGLGGFRLPSTVGEGSYSFVLSGDLNGDGVVDLVTGTTDMFGSTLNITSHIGRGDASFEPASSTPTGSGLAVARLVDFDSDGDLDLVGQEYRAAKQSFAVYYNNGVGEFSAPIRKDIATKFYYALGDTNGDGHVDVVFSNPNVPEIQVFLNNGNGTLEANPSWSAPASGTEGVELGDFDGDGLLDLVSKEVGVVWWKGAGDGTFQPAQTLAGPSGSHFRAVDLNNDGNLDILAVSRGGMFPLINGGNGSFTPMPKLAAIDVSLELGDVNGDGYVDVVSSGSNIYDFNQPRFVDSFVVSLNDGTGAFPRQTDHRLGGGEFSYGNQLITLGDFDGDGRPEIIGISRDTNTLSLFRNR